MPRDPLGLDLEECTPVLEGLGFEVLNARVMLVVSPGTMTECPAEVHLYRSGRMLIKTDTPVVAQAAAAVVCRAIGITEEV